MPAAAGEPHVLQQGDDGLDTVKAFRVVLGIVRENFLNVSQSPAGGVRGQASVKILFVLHKITSDKAYHIYGKYASAYTRYLKNGYHILEVMGMGVKDAVAARFAAICRQRGMKYNELAVKSGVTPSTVYSMMDARRRDVSITTIKMLCDGLEISLEEFFSGEEFADLEQEIK